MGSRRRAFYTLLLTDPDSPGTTEDPSREVRHWLAMNIPGSDVSKGDEVIQYIGAASPMGLHRHIFLVYKQPNGIIEHNEPRASNRYNQNLFPYSDLFLSIIYFSISIINSVNFYDHSRSRWYRVNTSTMDLAEKHNLGDPDFGNFFLAEYDPYTKILHMQLAESHFRYVDYLHYYQFVLHD